MNDIRSCSVRPPLSPRISVGPRVMVGVELVHLDRIVALLHEHGCSAGGACGREPPCGKAYGAEIRAHSVPVRYAFPSEGVANGDPAHVSRKHRLPLSHIHGHISTPNLDVSNLDAGLCRQSGGHRMPDNHPCRPSVIGRAKY